MNKDIKHTLCPIFVWLNPYETSLLSHVITQATGTSPSLSDNSAWQYNNRKFWIIGISKVRRKGMIPILVLHPSNKVDFYPV